MARGVYAEWDEEDAFDERPARPLRRKRLPLLRILLLSAVSIAGLSYFAQQRERGVAPSGPQPVPSSVLIAPAPVWKPVAAAPAQFTFEKAPGPVTLEARQHTSGAREDILVLRSFGDAAHARITFVQGLAEPERGLYIDIVRRAAQAGLAVARHGMSRMVPTKFGPMETAPIALAGESEQNCQAFRFADPISAFGFQGWVCDLDAGAGDDARLACFIDGIVPGGPASPSAKAVFSRAERARSACAPSAQTAAAGGRLPRQR